MLGGLLLQCISLLFLLPLLHLGMVCVCVSILKIMYLLKFLLCAHVICMLQYEFQASGYYVVLCCSISFNIFNISCCFDLDLFFFIIIMLLQ